MGKRFNYQRCGADIACCLELRQSSSASQAQGWLKVQGVAVEFHYQKGWYKALFAVSGFRWQLVRRLRDHCL